MAHAFWHLDWQGHPWNKPTYDPRKAVIRDGVDVTVGGQVPLDLRNPYQIATDPRFLSGTGPGLGQIEKPSFSASRIATKLTSGKSKPSLSKFIPTTTS